MNDEARIQFIEGQLAFRFPVAPGEVRWLIERLKASAIKAPTGITAEDRARLLLLVEQERFDDLHVAIAALPVVGMQENNDRKENKVKKNRRTVVVTNDGYGIYYGQIEASDAEIAATKAVRVFSCRHVARWYGGTGGITSLAAWGPKGNDNRIGAPVDALITKVANVFDVGDGAAAAFDAVKATR